MRTDHARLGDLIRFNPPTPKGLLASDTEVAVVPMAAVSEQGRMQVHEYRPAYEVSSGLSYFSDGDVLVAKITPCYENNKITQASVDRDHAFGSTEFHVLRPDRNQIDGRYLTHFLRQDAVRQVGVRRMTGSGGQRRVPRSFLEELEIPLPPLDEQRRIAAVLDQTDALRGKRREALTTQDRLAEAYFHALFGDPMTNPMGWPVRPLGELGELERGVSKHRPRNDPALLGGPYPLIQTGDVANADGIIESYNSTYTEKGLKQSRIWPKGTLCITIAANIGKTATLGFDACFPDSVVGFAPSDRVNIHYIQFLFMSLQEKLEREAPESAQKNINLAILRGLLVPVPPIAIQNRFSAVVERQRATRNASKSHLAQLDALFASLQHRAFRGEL